MPPQEILGSPEAHLLTAIAIMDHGLKIPVKVKRVHTPCMEQKLQTNNGKWS